jgi:Mlc titration factor MtfA (ptsG expression regulator)
MFEFLRRWRQARRLAKIRVDASLWERVEATLPFLAYLDDDARARLRELARRFLADKEFHGADGMVLTDEIMLSIALQACLPVLNIGLEAYRGWVGVIVYPGDFVIPRSEVDEDGVVHEFDDEVLGEAWEGGPVLVSWPPPDAAHEGVNVVIHEFAHKLDMTNGMADGLPPLPARMSRSEWARVFTEAYESLCEQVDAGLPTAIDPYGAEHPAEFFAVASEAFFETPVRLREAFPAVYAQLRALYRLDPAARAAHAGGESPHGANATSDPR